MDLNQIREELDKLDYELVEVIAKRMNLIPVVAKYKIENNLEIVHPQREKEILIAKQELAKKLGVNPELIKTIFRSIIDDATRIQKEEFAFLNKN